MRRSRCSHLAAASWRHLRRDRRGRGEGGCFEAGELPRRILHLHRPQRIAPPDPQSHAKLTTLTTRVSKLRLKH